MIALILYTYNFMRLLGRSNRVHDKLALLVGDDDLLLLRRVLNDDDPANAPEQAEQALNVEDPLPSKEGRYQNRQQYRDHRAQGRS